MFRVLGIGGPGVVLDIGEGLGGGGGGVGAGIDLFSGGDEEGEGGQI